VRGRVARERESAGRMGWIVSFEDGGLRAGSTGQTPRTTGILGRRPGWMVGTRK